MEALRRALLVTFDVIAVTALIVILVPLGLLVLVVRTVEQLAGLDD